MACEKINILIIGAGKGGATLIEILSGNKSVNILGIVDINPEAPGVKLAKRLGISTAKGWKRFMNDEALNEIVDLTGSPEVYQALLKEKPADADIIGGPAGKIMKLLLEERKKAEDALRESEEEFKAIIENIDDIIFQLFPLGFIQYVNPKVEELYGYKPQGLIGKHLSKTTPVSEMPKVLEALKRALTGEVIRNFLVNQLDSKGRLIPVEINITPVKKDGKIIAIQGVMRDITERKGAMEELKRVKDELEIQAWGLKKANEGIKLLYKELDAKNKELEKLDKLKDDFISTVSHELRTPLSITKEGISLILDRIPGEINEKQQKILAMARDNMDRLGRIINNLLDISKIEAGKIELKRKAINLNSLAEKIISSFEPHVEAKGLKMKASLPKKSMDVYADADKLTQVFTNLISNAVKFTEKGHIEISVQDKETELECAVVDTGRGISEEDLPKIFSKFQQFGRTAGGGEKGTGLGLSIAKGIVELHKGRIWIESKLGKGTKFIFTLPKYTPETLLREFVDHGIERAKKSDSKISLILVSIAEFNKLKQQYPTQKMKSILKDMENIVENAMRRSEDSALGYTSGIAALLTDCDKENALAVGNRFKETLQDYLDGRALSGEIKLHFGCATYSDDAKNAEELVKKARKV